MSDARILYLSRADVNRASDVGSQLYVEAVSRALGLHAERKFVQPLKPYLRWRGDDNHVADRIIAMPAYLGGEQPAAGLKWVGSKHDNPSRHGLERASALTILNDVDTHYPIAVMEGGLISNLRTAAVTAVATRYLAREGFTSVACLGAGPIGTMQVKLLLECFSSIADVRLFDLRRAPAEQLAAAITAKHPQVRVSVADSAKQAVHEAEVVVTATVADRPYLPFQWLSPGTFLSNVSIMDVHKEVFLQVDKVVVDDWDQCNREKKVINQLVEEGRFSREQLHAELGQIVAKMRPGRETRDEVILLNPMGMAVEDVACAQAVYQAALERGIGTWLTL